MRRAALAAPLFLLAAASMARATPSATRFGLTLHVAADDRGVAVADRPWLEAWVREASAYFAPADLAFAIEDVRHLGPSSDVLRTNRDRHALARHFVERRINVFVVTRIEDPRPSRATVRAAALRGHTLSGRLGGAHVRTRGHEPGTYVIVLAGSHPTTLAHELGHFFGAGHHPDEENIMSYGRERHRFDERQLAAFRHFTRRFVRRGVLRPMPDAAPSAIPSGGR